jgi:hypothetical protein
MQDNLKLSKHHTQDSAAKASSRLSVATKRNEEIFDTEILQKTIDNKALSIYRSNIVVT